MRVWWLDGDGWPRPSVRRADSTQAQVQVRVQEEVQRYETRECSPSKKSKCQNNPCLDMSARVFACAVGESDGGNPDDAPPRVQWNGGLGLGSSFFGLAGYWERVHE